MGEISTIAALAVAVIYLGAPTESIIRQRFGYGNMHPAARLVRVAILIAIMMLGVVDAGLSLEQIGFRWTSPGQIGLMTILFSGLLVGLDLWAACVLRSSPQIASKAARHLVGWEAHSLLGKTLYITYIGISAIYEEMAFRGVAFYIGKMLGAPTLLILVASTLVFGLQHIAMGVRALYTLYFGALFGLMYVISDTLFPVIIAHFTANAVTVLIIGPLLRAQSGRSLANRMPF